MAAAHAPRAPSEFDLVPRQCVRVLGGPRFLTCIFVLRTSVGCSMTAERTPEAHPDAKLAIVCIFPPFAILSRSWVAGFLPSLDSRLIGPLRGHNEDLTLRYLVDVPAGREWLKADRVEDMPLRRVSEASIQL